MNDMAENRHPPVDGVDPDKVLELSEELKKIGKALKFDPVLHVAAALSFAGKAVNDGTKGHDLSAITYSMAVDSNLQRAEYYLQPLHHSKTGRIISFMASSLYNAAACLLREDYDTGRKYVEDALTTGAELATEFKRERKEKVPMTPDQEMAALKAGIKSA